MNAFCMPQLQFVSNKSKSEPIVTYIEQVILKVSSFLPFFLPFFMLTLTLYTTGLFCVMRFLFKFGRANAPPIATGDIFVLILSQKWFSFIFTYTNTPLMEVDSFFCIYFHFDAGFGEIGCFVSNFYSEHPLFWKNITFKIRKPDVRKKF